MASKKSLTGHDDLDAQIDKVLERHGGSIKPSDSGWNRVHNLMDQGRKRDESAKAKQTPKPSAPAPKSRGIIKRGKK